MRWLRSLALLTFIASALISCSKPQEPLVLLCDGIETVYGSENGKPMGSESIKVKRTFNFFQDYRTVKTGIFSTEIIDKQLEISSDFKEVKKLVWILSVDNGQEIFETDTFVIYEPNSNRKNYGRVVVNSSELSAAEEYTSKFKENSTSRIDYLVDINRISGDFREMTNERYSELAAFRIETKGNCKQVKNKF